MKFHWPGTLKSYPIPAALQNINQNWKPASNYFFTCYFLGMAL